MESEPLDSRALLEKFPNSRSEAFAVRILEPCQLGPHSLFEMMPPHETVKLLASLVDALGRDHGFLDAVIPLLHEFTEGTTGIQRLLGVTSRGLTYVTGVALALPTTRRP